MFSEALRKSKLFSKSDTDWRIIDQHFEWIPTITYHGSLLICWRMHDMETVLIEEEEHGVLEINRYTVRLSSHSDSRQDFIIPS
jgi:hypothetical protein